MKLSELFEDVKNENSSGTIIHHNPNSVMNFWKWFGHSKVVDDSNRPLVLYHGTGNDIQTFQSKNLNIPNTDHVLDIGIHFSKKVEPANKYAINVRHDDSHIRKYSSETSLGKHPTVYPVYLKIEKLCDLTKPLSTELLNDINHLAKSNNIDLNINKIQKNKQYILTMLSVMQRKLGRSSIMNLFKHYDGIKYHLLMSDCYVVFKSNQIKSAIGNNGNFSISSNNINESLLFEYPMYHEDLNDHPLNNPDGNKEYFDKFIKMVHPIEELSDGVILYHFENSKGGTYLAANPKTKSVYYLMQYNRSFHNLIGKFVYQKFLWIDKSKRSIIGHLPSYYFYDLIDDYFTIATDAEQTKNGEQFWKRRIKEAFSKNLNVYYFNDDLDHLEQLESSNDVEIFNNKYQIYSNHESSLHKAFVISSKQLMKNINESLELSDSYKIFKFQDTKIQYNLHNGIINIASVRTPILKRGQGSAKNAMIQFLKMSDSLNIPTKLSSSPLDKKTNDLKLLNFYKSLGYGETGKIINMVGDKELYRTVGGL